MLIISCISTFSWIPKLRVADSYPLGAFILPRLIKLVPGTPGDLTCDLRQLNSIHSKAPWKFLKGHIKGKLNYKSRYFFKDMKAFSDFSSCVIKYDLPFVRLTVMHKLQLTSNLGINFVRSFLPIDIFLLCGKFHLK